MSTLHNFFDSIGTELQHLRERRRALDVTEASDFTTFQYINPDENGLSDIIADLLNPRECHGQGTAFLEQFLVTAGIDINAPLVAAKVQREGSTDLLERARRIDITLEIGDVGVGIENKPWAHDQEDQVADYVRHLRGRYGDGRFFMLYLSRDGSHPASLPDADRVRLEQDGRYRTIALGSDDGLVGWLRLCRRVCRAPNVSVFVDDFARYLEMEFGNRTCGGKMETDLIVSHALHNSDNLSIALDVAAARAAIAERIISDFAVALAAKVTEELSVHGDGWRVQNRVQQPEPAAPTQQVAITKTGWLGGDTWTTCLRAALILDSSNAVYFDVRRDYDTNRSEAERSVPLANRIATTLTKHCGRGDSKSGWWPFWWKNPEMLRQWKTDAALLELHRKDKPLEYFAKRLVTMALAVDEALLESPSGRV